MSVRPINSFLMADKDDFDFILGYELIEIQDFTPYPQSFSFRFRSTMTSSLSLLRISSKLLKLLALSRIPRHLLPSITVGFCRRINFIN
ncbi:hypothetical protein ERO13_A13G057950v2 [Gossypium hirsutum]|nr:hypothetical protein ERO13_A13G057950v2 [Gossypium hirsutum]KAG4165074.1 hypothetical protein ERO13_A13G057950v2 [Gossypium hirsutum]KAG4165075.1 hypothetical protein ERO13_A13G057950v2 [Gossypium hirsutum]